MVQIDNSDALRVVTELTAASSSYQRHFVLWLGVGSAGGSVALLSFAANLPDPDFALRALLPALVGFAIGVALAAATVLFFALREGAAASHHGEAYNRDELARAIRSMPEVFSSPRRIADEMNDGRDKLIERNRRAHERAEFSWSRRNRWHIAYLACAVISTSGFLFGMGWPIGYVAAGGQFVQRARTPVEVSVSHGHLERRSSN